MKSIIEEAKEIAELLGVPLQSVQPVVACGRFDRENSAAELCDVVIPAGRSLVVTRLEARSFPLSENGVTPLFHKQVSGFYVPAALWWETNSGVSVLNFDASFTTEGAVFQVFDGGQTVTLNVSHFTYSGEHGVTAHVLSEVRVTGFFVPSGAGEVAKEWAAYIIEKTAA